MNIFELAIGHTQLRVRVEAGEQTGTFKLYAAIQADNWMDHEQSPSVGLPAGSLLGIIRVRDETDFDFEGSGVFTGQELQSLAALIVQHPGFKPAI